MHPAFSVIFFTTLSGAGYGVLALIGVLLTSAPLGWLARDDEFAAKLLMGMAGWLVVLLVLSLTMVTIGLLSSTFHLGKPQRAWRAFSQWRTSWLSREGVLALATYVPTVALLGLALAVIFGNQASQNILVTAAPALGIAAAVLAALTVACTAMIYASLVPIPAWRHGLVMPAYLGFALQGGLAIVTAAIALMKWPAIPQAPVEQLLGGLALALGLVSLVLTAIKIRYWRDIDHQAMPATRGDAVGLPDREVSVFERPHSEQNYLTREMGFVVARKHAHKLRTIALILFGLVPVIAAVLVWAFPAAAAVAMSLAALSVLLGAFVERWLFFAQARHMVTLYY